MIEKFKGFMVVKFNPTTFLKTKKTNSQLISIFKA